MRLPKKRTVLIAVSAVFAACLVYVLSLLLEAHRITPSALDKAQMLEEAGIRIQDLPVEWKAIILRVEDPGFYEHNGVDLSTPGAGLTTITQGLVKSHFFQSFEPGLHAKLKQTLFALVLDRQLNKDLQLTLFLNTASFGPSKDGWVVGFPEAANAYFGKELLELTRVEFISLVAMLIGPVAYHPTNEPEALAERVSRIEALIAGRCEPVGLLDVYYEGCSQ
jgi:membrane peptidoglycan carboxypeptidase